jgi:hypothetical protein
MHIEVYGLMMIHGYNGYTCFIINDHIGYGHAYLMKV